MAVVFRECALMEAKEHEVAECLLSEREMRASAASGFSRLVAALEEEGLRREERLQQVAKRCTALEGKEDESFLLSPAKDALCLSDSIVDCLLLSWLSPAQHTAAHNRQVCVVSCISMGSFVLLCPPSGLLEEAALTSAERLKETEEAFQAKLAARMQELHEAHRYNKELKEEATLNPKP